MTYFIHKHNVAQAYGGPEEGGWWYDTGVPDEDWNVLRCAFDNEDMAYAVCRALNEYERERAKKEEQYEYTSMLSRHSDHYAYSVEDNPFMEPYPKVRPHYE